MVQHFTRNKKLFFQLKDIYERRKGGLHPDDKEIEESWERLWKKFHTHPAAVRELQEKGPQKQYLRNVIYASVAAVAVLLIISGVRLFLKDRGAVVWMEVRTAARSAPQAILLPDGSSVQLNASSFLKYPEKFSSKNREVYLDGEAYFNVVEDERRAFIVHTDKQDINVLGTQFNVLGYSSDPYTVTTLVTGKVKLETYDGQSNLKNEIVMHPNQQVYFDKSLNKTIVSHIDTNDAISWIKGIYSFRDTPLEDITCRLEKILGVTFVIPDETQRKEKYTGKFFTRQNVGEIVDVLNFKGQFRSEFRNDTIYLH